MVSAALHCEPENALREKARTHVEGHGRIGASAVLLVSVGSSESSIVSYILSNFYCCFQWEGCSQQGILSVPGLGVSHPFVKDCFYFFLRYILQNFFKADLL